MKFSPSIAFQPTDKLSFGLGLHVDYGRLDLKEGTAHGFGAGVQLGMIYKMTEQTSLGLTYTSPQNVDHDNVADFDGDGNLDKLKLEAPQQIGFGLAYDIGKFLVEGDVKWLNWSDANGYGDFDRSGPIPLP